MNEIATTSAKVVIDPALKGRIEDIVEELHSQNPQLLKNVTHIYALHTNNLGEFHPDEPGSIYVNIDLIETKVREKVELGMSETEANNEVLKEAIEEAVRKQIGGTIVHETEHLENPTKGEGVAEVAEELYMQSNNVFDKKYLLTRERKVITNRLNSFNKIAKEHLIDVVLYGKTLLEEDSKAIEKNLLKLNQQLLRSDKMKKLSSEILEQIFKEGDDDEKEIKNIVTFVKTLGI